MKKLALYILFIFGALLIPTIATILSPYMILTNRKLVVSKAALAKIEEVYA